MRGIERDRRIGPVRASCVTHAVVHRDAAWLVALLADEAALEGDPARAAGLELDAACIVRQRLGDPDGAVALLERAAARVPIAPRGAPAHPRRSRRAARSAQAERTDVLRVRRVRLTHLDDARSPRARAARDRDARGVARRPRGRRRGPRAGGGAVPGGRDARRRARSSLEAAGYLAKRHRALDSICRCATPGPERARRLLLAASLAALGGPVGARRRARARRRSSPTRRTRDAVDRLLEWLASPPATAASPRRARASRRMPTGPSTRPTTRAGSCTSRRSRCCKRRCSATPGRGGDVRGHLAHRPGAARRPRGLARAAASGGRRRFVWRGRCSTRPRETRGREDGGRTARPGRGGCVRATRSARSRSCATCSSRTPGHAGARQVERRTSRGGGAVGAGRRVARRVHRTRRGERERVDLWLARAELQRTRLRAPKDALASLRAVLAIDPQHPGAREGVAAQLEAIGDPRLLRDGLVELASMARVPAERARGFARAAEIDELVLSDDGTQPSSTRAPGGELPGTRGSRTASCACLHGSRASGKPGASRAALGARLEQRARRRRRERSTLRCALARRGERRPSARRRCSKSVLAADPTASTRSARSSASRAPTGMRR